VLRWSDQDPISLKGRPPLVVASRLREVNPALPDAMRRLLVSSAPLKLKGYAQSVRS